MYESIDYDCVDGDGAWETVSKTRKAKDKMKIDQRAAAPDKKPGTKGVKTAGTAGTRRQNKKGNANMPGKKPAPLMNWREAAKKKADTTEMQKRVFLKNVQISRSGKNHTQPANRQSVNSSSRGVVGGENMTGKSKAAEKNKFDSFQEYNKLFPNLSRCEGTEEESATIQTHPVQDYANVPPFYDLNGCDVTADVLRILNEAFMGDPGNISAPNQSTSHEHIQFMRPQQEYQVEDGLTDNSGLIDNSRYTNKSYGDCIGEMDTVNSNIHVVPSDVSVGGEVQNITHEDLLTIPVDRPEPNIVEVQSTGEQQQELKVNNLPQDVNLHTQNGLQYKSIAEKIVFDEKKENALTGRVQDSLPDTDKENVTSIKIKKKRRKRVKVQNKNKDEGRMPLNVNRQGNTDMQEDYIKKSYRSDQEVTTGANQTASDSGDLIEKLPTKVTKATKLTANIVTEMTTGVDACEQNADKDILGLESASMDSLASAVSKLNISQTDSNKICKSDNQNNNCQEAGIDDDDSCLDLTGLESKCNPDYFETLTKVNNQTDQEPTTNKPSDIEQADNSELMQGPGEGECPGVTQLLLDNTENKEFAESEEVKVEIEAFTDKIIDKTDITEGEGGKVVQENRKGDAESNKDSAENDAVRICQPCKDTPQVAGPEERQGKCAGKQGDAQEPIAETKVTYGDVIEYVMEHLKELYAGKDIDRFNPVTRIEHAPLPDELTKHLSLLRNLSYNYTPSLHLYDGVRRECCESSDSDLSNSFDNSSEDVGEKNDERSGNVDKDGEQVPLRRFHQKLQLFARLNHLHQVVSNPCLAAFLEDWKLREISEQFTSDVSDLFPDLIEGSKQTDESDLRNATCGMEINKESSRDASSAFESGGQDNVPSLSFDYGQVIEAIENRMSSLCFDRSGMEPKEKEQTVQTPGPKQSAGSLSAALIFPEKDVQGSLERSKDGAEDALKSLISSPRGSCDKGLQFFQHSFLSSPENVSDGANDSLQNNSGLVGAVTATCEQSTLLRNVRRFLWSQLTDIRVSLDREILELKRAKSCQKEHEERAWQGGDMTGTSRQEEEGTGLTNYVTDEVTTDVTIDDKDLLGKGWMDRTLVDNLDNPKDEGPSEKRNRRDYRAKKFKALPFWWMP